MTAENGIIIEKQLTYINTLWVHLLITNQSERRGSSNLIGDLLTKKMLRSILVALPELHYLLFFSTNGHNLPQSLINNKIEQMPTTKINHSKCFYILERKHFYPVITNKHSK